MKDRPLVLNAISWTAALSFAFIITAAIYVAHIALSTYYQATKQKQFALAIESSPSTALRSELFRTLIPAESREWLEVTDLLKSVDRREYARARQLSESSFSEALSPEEHKGITEDLRKLEDLEQKLSVLQRRVDSAKEEATDSTTTKKQQSLALLQSEAIKMQDERNNQMQNLKNTLIKNILNQVRTPVPTETYYIYQLVRESAREINTELPEIRSTLVPSPPSWYYQISSWIKPTFDAINKLYNGIFAEES